MLQLTKEGQGYVGKFDIGLQLTWNHQMPSLAAGECQLEGLQAIAPS
jgi:hypothetical protein